MGEQIIRILADLLDRGAVMLLEKLLETAATEGLTQLVEELMGDEPTVALAVAGISIIVIVLIGVLFKVHSHRKVSHNRKFNEVDDRVQRRTAARIARQSDAP